MQHKKRLARQSGRKVFADYNSLKWYLNHKSLSFLHVFSFSILINSFIKFLFFLTYSSYPQYKLYNVSSNSFILISLMFSFWFIFLSVFLMYCSNSYFSKSYPDGAPNTSFANMYPSYGLFYGFILNILFNIASFFFF